MEIQCPGCQKRLSIADQFAGQLVKCPLCTGMFTAPALPPQPTIVAPPAPAPVPPSEAAPLNAPIPFAPSPPPPPPPGPAPAPAAPPMPASRFEAEEVPAEPGDYTRTHAWQLRPATVRWVTPICLTILFVLSFFPWVSIPRLGGDAFNLQVRPAGLNLWEMAFAEPPWVSYVFYVILVVFLLVPLSWVKLSFEKNWVPRPPQLEPFWRWRSVVVGALLLATYLFPLAHFFQWNVLSDFNPMAIAMKLGLRVHLVAILACAVEYWLDRRNRRRLPPPEMTARW